MTGEGGGNSARPAVMLQISLLSCVFLYCMEVPDPMGGIVQSVPPSMPGKLNSTCVLVLLFIFKLHFLNTTIVSLMYSVEYKYQGSYSGRLALGSPLEFWELNRNEHLGSIYF